MKTVLRALLLMMMAAAIAVFLIYSRLPSWISQKIEKSAGVTTSIGTIGLSTHEIALTDFVMMNVPGSILPLALAIKNVSLAGPDLNWNQKRVSFEKMTMDRLYLSLEFESKNHTNGNWTVIINNFSNAQTSSTNHTFVFAIDQVDIQDILIDLVYKDNPQSIRKIKIDKITLKNIASDKELPLDQLTKIIMQQILKQIFSIENLGNMLKDILAPPSSPPFFNPLKPFFSMGTEVETEPQLP
jgi:hypothetical protein